MGPIDQYIANMQTAMLCDMTAALERCFQRLLGRIPTEADSADCQRYSWNSLDPGCSLAQAFTYKGRLVMTVVVTVGVNRVAWRIREMV